LVDSHSIVIDSANLVIRNGLGATAPAVNGLGNLIVGYNERSTIDLDTVGKRVGSHNVVVGRGHNYTKMGGMVVGFNNAITAIYASVAGGSGNTASGNYSCVSGGTSNSATYSYATVSGGTHGVASGQASTVSGGDFNTASATCASVSGGVNNRASAQNSTVSGGSAREVTGTEDWRAGSLFEDQ
jgi:hypothetical protein